jgi:glycosyltransferase involved in cell wall biosynthesis
MNFYKNNLKENYLEKNNDYIINYDNFLKKYGNIDLKYIKYFNNNLINCNSIQIINYFLKNLNIIYSFDSFLKKYNIDNFQKYRNIYPLLDDYEICKKIYSNLDIDINIDINIDNNNVILNNDINNYINNDINSEKVKIIKIAHIFVHLFEVGGGEKYLSKFNKYNNNKFDETLFIKEDNKTLFDITNNIIIYDSYENLNTILIKNNYDIIIDHQLYWVEYNITNISFNNIEKNKIIRITHGVPIHYNNINDFDYYYSVELYNDKNSDISWNNHIKFYNSLGIIRNNINFQNKNERQRIKDFNNLNIAIVGRICPHKIPIDFLENLLKFVKTINKNNKSIIFNFYGPIDNSYKKLFFEKINDNKYIFYKGVIKEHDIENEIYTKNNILLHPSLSEAGATVILEAMSHGLPVICRTTGGLKETVNNGYELFANSSEDFFKNIMKINDSNINEIYEKNILKVLKYNNEPCSLVELKMSDSYSFEICFDCTRYALSGSLNPRSALIGLMMGP